MNAVTKVDIKESVERFIEIHVEQNNELLLDHDWCDSIQFIDCTISKVIKDELEIELTDDQLELVIDHICQNQEDYLTLSHGHYCGSTEVSFGDSQEIEIDMFYLFNKPLKKSQIQVINDNTSLYVRDSGEYGYYYNPTYICIELSRIDFEALFSD